MFTWNWQSVTCEMNYMSCCDCSRTFNLCIHIFEEEKLFSSELLKVYNCRKKHIRFDHLNLFKCSLMLVIFTFLCNRSLETFHLAKLRLFTHRTTPRFPLPLAPTTILLLIFMSLSTLGIICKWNNTIFVFL